MLPFYIKFIVISFTSKQLYPVLLARAEHSWVTRCIAKHTLYRNAWFAGALVLAVHTYSCMFMHVCVYMRMCMCASPPSREHGAVERMRNVGVEEVREGGKGQPGG